MRNRIKNFRNAVAVNWLKIRRRQINAGPKVRVPVVGRNGNIRHKSVKEVDQIERRMRVLSDLMMHEKKNALNSVERNIPMSERREFVLGYGKLYLEYKAEFDELAKRLGEIPIEQNKQRQSTRKTARKIAGKKPSYLEGEIVSEGPVKDRKKIN